MTFYQPRYNQLLTEFVNIPAIQNLKRCIHLQYHVDVFSSKTTGNSTFFKNINVETR